MSKKRRSRLFQMSQRLEDRETPTADPFTLVALPDTQHYAQYSNLNNIFYAQTQWVVDHRVDQNIRFVLGLGDIVNDGASIPEQWVVADAAYDKLDGDLQANPDGLIPYSTPPGNHDYNTVGDHYSGTTVYDQYFGAARFQGRSWFGGDYRGINTYSYFSAGGYQFLQLALEFEPTDDDIDWARIVLRNNPGMPTILTTHNYVYDVTQTRKITHSTPDGASGETLFRKLVYPNPQIFMVLNGHWDQSGAPPGGAGEYQQTSYNVAGLPVFEMLSDYQEHDSLSGANQASGLMRILHFDPNAGAIHVQTYSPSQNYWETDANSDFTYNLDFAQRFANDAPDPVRFSSFQEGVDIGYGTYTGTQDTFLWQTNPTTSYGDSTIDLLVDYPTGTEASQVLLRFDNIFGNGPGQVPLGSRILSATLAVDSNNQGAGGKLHRMVGAWSESSTWSNTGSGIQANGTEARTTYESQAGVSALSPIVVAGTTPVGFNVTADVKAWAAGETNRGWAILPWTGGTDGWAFAPSEAANPLLRPRLRIEWLPATADPNIKTLTFQQGLNGYSGAVDTYLSEGAPTTAYGTAPVLYMDVTTPDDPPPAPPTLDGFMALLRFDQLFGLGSNQIRPDAQIEAAYLYLMTPGFTNAPGGGTEIDRMLMMWTATDTWNTFGGDAVQANNIEALGTPDWNTGSVIYGEIRIDVTPSLKLWQTGATNRGWAFLPNSTDQWQYFSSDSEAINERPRLVVVAKNVPPKVESVVINNGAAQRSRVDSITINFSTMMFGPGATPPTASAFELKRSDGLVALAMATVQNVNNKTSVILNNFSGTPTEYSSLADGRWNMRIYSSLTNSDGVQLDGDGNGTGGDDYVMIGDPATNKLFRLYGDSDGNNLVDQADFIAFRNSFNSGPSSIFDFDGNGQVDQTDFIQFRNRFNLSV